MTTMTRDAFGPELEAQAAAAYATIPHPIPPQDTPMHEYDIRFTFATRTRSGGTVNESDIKRIEAEDTPRALRAFNAWFKETYGEGADLRSTSVIQVPDFKNPRT